MRLAFAAGLSLFLSLNTSFAQHQHGHQPDTAQTRDTTAFPEHRTRVALRPDTSRPLHEAMQSALFQDAPMNRDGSGTSWLPDNAALPAIHRQIGSWGLMFHGSQFLRYAKQNFNNDSKRGSDEVTAPNWMMAMLHRATGDRGKFTARMMISLDRLSEGGNGYPLLLQTGESWEGKPLVDLQHPHDLFSELAVAYAYRVGEDAAIFGYFGYPGEPALGPTVFMHRPSALNNPDAPLSHHWQDATHIQFGVATAGVQIGQFKLDGSVFTGREPDENRWNFDKPRFDSYSLRGTANLLGVATAQVSWAFLNEPEWTEPGVDQRRTTASLIYLLPVGENIAFTASLVWGMNDATDFRPQHSFLNESELRIHETTLYSRWEFVQKSSHELGVADLLGEEGRFDIWQFTGGIAQQILSFGNFDLSVGGNVTGNVLQKALKPFYGDFPLSYSLQLRLSPTPTMDMKGM